MNYRIKFIFIISTISILSFACQSSIKSPQDVLKSSNSYYHAEYGITIDKTNKGDIQKIFGPPTFTSGTSHDEESGLPSDSWFYLSFQTKGQNKPGFNFFQFNQRGFLEKFMICEVISIDILDDLPEKYKSFRKLPKVGEANKITRHELEAKYGGPDMKAVGGPSEITGSFVEIWMYFSKIGEAGGGFVVFSFDNNGKLLKHMTIGIEDIRNIEKMFEKD